MKNKAKIAFHLSALLLAVALLLPYGAKLVHTLDGHAHSICSDVSTHIHTDEPECDIDLFHFSSFDFVTFTFNSQKREYLAHSSENVYLYNYTNKNKQGPTLRGPPHLS